MQFPFPQLSIKHFDILNTFLNPQQCLPLKSHTTSQTPISQPYLYEIAATLKVKLFIRRSSTQSKHPISLNYTKLITCFTRKKKLNFQSKTIEINGTNSRRHKTHLTEQTEPQSTKAWEYLALVLQHMQTMCSILLALADTWNHAQHQVLLFSQAGSQTVSHTHLFFSSFKTALLFIQTQDVPLPFVHPHRQCLTQLISVDFYGIEGICIHNHK